MTTVVELFVMVSSAVTSLTDSWASVLSSVALSVKRMHNNTIIYLRQS